MQNVQAILVDEQRGDSKKDGSPYHVLSFAIDLDDRVFVSRYFVPKVEVGNPIHDDHKLSGVYTLEIEKVNKGGMSYWAISGVKAGSPYATAKIVYGESKKK